MLRSIWTLFLREIRLVLVEHSLLLTLLGAPLLYAFMYGSIYINKTEENVPLAVVDQDDSSLSRIFIQELSSDPMIDVVLVHDLAAAKRLVNYGDVFGYLYIDRGFESNILSLKQSNVSLAVNAARFLPAGDLTAHITTVALTVGGGVRKTYFNKQGMSDAEAMVNTNPIHLDFRPMFNESSGYGGFLLPGLLAIILQQTLLIGLCVSMSIERKNKKIPELRALSLNNPSNLLFGKGLFYFITYLIFSNFFLTVAFSVFHIPFRGSLLEANLLMSVFLASLIPLAFFIGSFFKNTLLIIQIMGFSSYPIFLITGYSMPFGNLPTGVQWISQLLPTTPFLRIYTMLVQGGANLSYYIPSLLHLSGLAVLYTFFYLARIRYLNRLSAKFQ